MGLEKVKVRMKKNIITNKIEVIPYENPKALAEFLNQPQVKIAELVTGALSLGSSEAILISGRLVQGALKGNLMKQVGREIQDLIKKGRISEDYANSKYGFQTLAELLAFIDSEAPDEDRFNAVKGLFYAIIDKESKGSEILKYQLFQIAKKLNSSQLLTLKASYEMKTEKSTPSSAESWRVTVAQKIGHNSPGLVWNDEVALEQEKLIGSTTFSDNSGIRNAESARLTDLGIKLVESITQYEGFADDK